MAGSYNVTQFLQLTKSVCSKNTCQILRCSNLGALSQHNYRSTASLLQYLRHFTLSTPRHYEVRPKQRELPKTDLRQDANRIFEGGLQAVHPQHLIGNVLKLHPGSSTLHVKEQRFRLKRNVFVVGMGNAVLGMARAVEEILKEHLVCGVISIPHGLQDEIKSAESSEQMLIPSSKIQVYEGAKNNLTDAAALNASRAIHSLIKKLTEKDILIVLCSGGGSALCPLPRPPITMDELSTVNRLLSERGATMRELNTVLKTIEILKGGGLVRQAQPAQVVSLILSSMIGDPIDLIASGPTVVQSQAPRQSFQIFKRYGLMSLVPEGIKKYLDAQIRIQELAKTQEITPISSIYGDATWSKVHNIVVGNNASACEGAASKAEEMGYLPIVIDMIVTGEARDVGVLCAKMMRFITMCFDRKASQEPNAEMAILEIQLVSGGFTKECVNHIAAQVERANNLNMDVCLIMGAGTTVTVKGSGVGGKNLELAAGAAIQMDKDLRKTVRRRNSPEMCLLSANSGGWDGAAPVAGAVVDQDFLESVDNSEMTCADVLDYLNNNDTYTFFSNVNDGKNVVLMNRWRTNVMDLVFLLVQRPEF